MQSKLDVAKLLAQLNEQLGRNFQLTSLPAKPVDPWPAAPTETHAQWWEARRARQKEIDESIARNAVPEYLYDRPYKARSVVRVAGPFTVESLSPDRIVSTDEERPASELLGQRQPGRADFATMVLDNLRKAGVQNTFKNERLTFDRLEPHAGAWIHATGEYTNGDGKTRRVAVTIGPEYGTVTLGRSRKPRRKPSPASASTS